MTYVFVSLSESANEYTDDEDASWKVRRAAAKCLAGLIVSRSEMISKVYQEVYLFFNNDPEDYILNNFFIF